MVKLQGDVRSAAISALISLIMVLGYHVIIQGVEIFHEPTSPEAAPGASAPGMRPGPGGSGFGPGMGAPGMRPGPGAPGAGPTAEGPGSQLELLRDEVKLRRQLVELYEGQQQAGDNTFNHLDKARMEMEKAQLRLLRAELGIRSRGTSAAETWIDLVGAERHLGSLEQMFSSGSIPLTEVTRAKVEINQLKQQLLRNRVAGSEAFKAAAEAWKKDASEANLKALLEAEAAARRQ